MHRTVWPSLSPESTARIVFPASLALLTVAGIVLTLPYHLQHVPLVSRFTSQDINPWGKVQPNKYFALAFLVMFGLINWLYFFRSFRSHWWQRSSEHPERDNRTSSLFMVLTVCSILIMLTIGLPVRLPALSTDM
jgi:formate hydrogenlyase subunit 3/multisubunit Na+/H+ antiporter MnhD subunit